MIAFVLSGAGNRGPLEVGALRALLEAGIKPDLIVGTSAGAINGAFLAAHGATPESTKKMEDVWASVSPWEIYPENILQILWRIKSKANSVFSGGGVRRLLERSFPADVRTFGQLKIKLYTTATDLRSSRLFIFGDEPDVSLLDAVQASMSIPGIHPPVRYFEAQLVDGGVLANVPASIAMDRGATTLYVINAGYGGEVINPAQGVLEVITHTIRTMMAQGLLEDIDRAKADTGVDLHHITVNAFEHVSFLDFSKSREMVKVGYEKAKAYLVAPAPFVPEAAAVPAPSTLLPGATQYIPPYLR